MRIVSLVEILEDPLAIRESDIGWLAALVVEQLGPAGSDVSPDTLEGLAEGALGETGLRVPRGPSEVGVAEVQRRLAVLLVAAVGQRRVAVLGRLRADNPAAGQEEVQDDLQVETPVPGRAEHGDERHAQRRHAIAPTAMRGVVRSRHLGEWVDVLVLEEDVAGCHDLVEAVLVRHVADLLAVTADDEDRLVGVFGDESTEGSMRLNELGLVDVDVETRRDLFRMLLLAKTAAVCEKGEGDGMPLELEESFSGAGERLAASHEDAVDIEDEGCRILLRIQAGLKGNGGTPSSLPYRLIGRGGRVHRLELTFQEIQRTAGFA